MHQRIDVLRSRAREAARRRFFGGYGVQTTADTDRLRTGHGCGRVMDSLGSVRNVATPIKAEGRGPLQVIVLPLDPRQAITDVFRCTSSPNALSAR